MPVCVVGAGPTGLTVALRLRQLGYEVILLDENLAVGGCHRVIRDRKDRFTNHSPMVYVKKAGNEAFRHLIENDLSATWEEMFVPYQTTAGLLTAVLHQLPVRDLVKLGWGLLRHPKTGSVLEFCIEKEISPQGMEVLNHICLLSDGASIERYSLRQFFALVEHPTGRLYQPRLANDMPEGLFGRWKWLLSTLGVQMLLGHRAFFQVKDRARLAISSISSITSKNLQEWDYVFCCSPSALRETLLFSGLDPGFVLAEEKTQATEYHLYLNLFFYFNCHQVLPNLNPFALPKLPEDFDSLGVVPLVVSQFTDLGDPGFVTLSAITTSNAALSLPPNTLVPRVWQELLLLLPDLATFPRPEISWNPRLEFDTKTMRWADRDQGYVAVAGSPPYPWLACPKLCDNLFLVGPANGFSEYPFTSIEAAVENAEFFVKTFHRHRGAPSTKGSPRPGETHPPSLNQSAFSFFGES